MFGGPPVSTAHNIGPKNLRNKGNPTERWRSLNVYPASRMLAMKTVFSIKYIAVAAGLCLLTSCAAQPTAQDLATSIKKASDADPTLNTSDEQSLCIAAILLEADLSDTSLSGLAKDFADPTVLVTEKKKIERTVQEAAAICKS